MNSAVGLLLLLSFPSNYHGPLHPILHHAKSQGLLVQPHPNVFVLGTVHIGSGSAEEAEVLVQAVHRHHLTAVIVEASSSRVEAIRSKRYIHAAPNPINVLFQIAPTLLRRGWHVGRMGGLLLCLAMSYTLFKRSFDDDERVDEFSAAVLAADSVQAKVIAADVELDDLIAQASKCMTISSWRKLFGASVAESFGWKDKDPLLRRPGESMSNWAARRRNVGTARASKAHGVAPCPEFSKLLVDDRDARFVECYQKAKEELDDNYAYSIVIIVGLVHLDGVVKGIQEIG